jgi:hypothetical protein
MLARSARSLAAAALATLAWASTSPARAADPPPDSPNLDILLFEPALGTHSFLTVGGAEPMNKGQLQLQLGLSYATHPFSVYVVDASSSSLQGKRSDVVESLLVGYLSFAYGVTPSLQLGALLPAVFSAKGQGLDPSTGMPQAGGLSVSGLGDARLEAVWRVYERRRMTLALVPALTVPTSTRLGSDQSSFLGDELPTFRPRVAWQWSSEGARWGLGANLGVILRKPHSVYSSDVGQQLSYGLAAELAATNRVAVIGELFGRKGFSLDTDESPLEIDGALRVDLGRGLGVQVGGGAGLVKGVGAPSARMFASLSWAPDYGDNDGDGISNQNDLCPNEPEDKDGFQDQDGCPDPDNDGDGLPDDQDKCPNQPEDKDGFQDQDGCPDLDNDQDGIPDEKDACPNDAEDHLPPNPDDGCPRGMGPGDESAAPAPTAVSAPAGASPAAAPAADRDHDGIPDAVDQCPDQPETVNGVKDDDGCPDSGGKVLARLQGTDIELLKAIDFDGPRVRTASRPALEQAALLMRGQAYLVGKWRVTVTSDRKTKPEAASARAEAVKALLVERGVPAAAVETAVQAGPRAGVKLQGVARADGSPITDEPQIEIVPR